MASKPFQNSPPDAQLQTPVDKGSGPEPETPTQQRKAGGLALSQGMSSALDVTQTPQQGEGRWYGLAA
ncbi:hypothetical protein BD324DRAFT_621526 [Kockovaella imperatae]|uniref:Uncharacterized protein n=1 Tax=Kockovaella imperatae TaxID=4999 RepID=A0A1Y1UM43_9TREE|nr:hypothetical protein BD324DRAFT_621526 [Kockovaella imperatae]ORX38597.1 hypothetical protein BD324DRAFT_621526 [Kockovaella imperatae]